MGGRTKITVGALVGEVADAEKSNAMGIRTADRTAGGRTVGAPPIVAAE